MVRAGAPTTLRGPQWTDLGSLGLAPTGEPVNHVRGEWQIARTYATIGRGEPAGYHAKRCLELCDVHGVGDFDLAYAYEALASAHAIEGEAGAAEHYKRQAYEAAEEIADPEDRELVLSDLATLAG